MDSDSKKHKRRFSVKLACILQNYYKSLKQTHAQQFIQRKLGLHFGALCLDDGVALDFRLNGLDLSNYAFSNFKSTLRVGLDSQVFEDR